MACQRSIAQSAQRALGAICRTSVDGLAVQRGSHPALEAVVTLDDRPPGAARYTLHVVVPRAMLSQLFARSVPRERDAEVELRDALSRFARKTACQLARMRARRDGPRAEVTGVVTRSAGTPARDEVVMRVGDGWIAVGVVSDA